METMRYQENKKSYKGAIFGFFAFVIVGGGLIYFAISQEKEPEIIGKSKSDIQGLVDVSKSGKDSTLVDVSYKVEDKVISDKKNTKLKGNITIPQVFVNNEALTQINEKIENEYTSRFESLQEQMKSAENKFTYTVTYNKYENVVGNAKILSLTIYQRIIDDASKKNTTDKVESYNINLETGNLVDESEVMLEMFGKEYKLKVNDAVKSYVINKGYKSEEVFSYTVTGLENYYIKDGKLHILFNEDEIVDKKHGVLDIVVE